MMAIGMVAATVYVDQSELCMALTTAMERPAKVKIKMASTAQAATNPVVLSISVVAM